MENDILEIIQFHYAPDSDVRNENAAWDVANKFKAFILWKDDIKCPFNLCYNGEDKDRPRVEYEKGNKHFTIEDVWNFWVNLKT